MRLRAVVSPVLAVTALLSATAGVAVVDVLDRQGEARPVRADAGRATPPAGEREITVNGALVPDVPGSTVAAALRDAGIELTPGHYLSVRTRRVLGSVDEPGSVLVDGRPAPLTSVVPPGATLVIRPGRDLVEPTEVVTAAIAPPVPTPLYVDGRAGVERIVRGRFSHEVVSRRMVRKPTVGRLVRPGAVALTFDDGPSSTWTRRVLALLERRHVHATFCFIGRQAAAHPAVVRRVARSGHALCNHTWDHDLALRSRPRPQIALDIRLGSRAVVRATHGLRPAFFRAPGGRWSKAIVAEARAAGMLPLRWTVDPRDWARPGTTSIVRTVLAQLQPGAVILMHDGGGNRAQSYAALRILLHRLPRMGYHFVLPPSGR